MEYFCSLTTQIQHSCWWGRKGVVSSRCDAYHINAQKASTTHPPTHICDECVETVTLSVRPFVGTSLVATFCKNDVRYVVRQFLLIAAPLHLSIFLFCCANATDHHRISAQCTHLKWTTTVVRFGRTKGDFYQFKVNSWMLGGSILVNIIFSLFVIYSYRLHPRREVHFENGYSFHSKPPRWSILCALLKED